MRSRSPRSALVAAVAVAALAVGACSKSDTASTTATTAAGSKGSTPGSAKVADLSAKLSGVKLVKDGTLTICSDIPYAPFEFPDDDKGGELTGFDVQLVNSMAKSLGASTDWKTTPFDSIIASLAAGNCDMIASATTIKPERAEKVNFSQPYFDADQSLLVLTKNKDTYKQLSDLAGKTIGVQSGTTGADYATANAPAGATIKEFQGADDLFAALSSGQIDAVLQDYPVNAYRVVKNPQQFVVTQKITTGEQYGLATAKGNDQLTAALDAALAQAKSDGTYDQIYTTWFGQKQQ